MEHTRQMDNLRRIVLPKHLCDAFAWGAGTKLEITLSHADQNEMVIRQAYPTCSLCREETQNLKEIEKGQICPQCAQQVK